MNLSSPSSSQGDNPSGRPTAVSAVAMPKMSPGRANGLAASVSLIKVERPSSPMDASVVTTSGSAGACGPILAATSTPTTLSTALTATWGDNSSGASSSRLSEVTSEIEDYTLIGDFRGITGDPSSNLQDDFQQQYDSSSPGGYSSPAESIEMKPSTDADECFLQMLDPGTLNLAPDSQLADGAKATVESGVAQFGADDDQELNFLRDGDRRMCLVCGDVASGFHYGVASCEACKAFFKRTIQGNIDYSCPAHGECEITKRRRKACQACRFQKCLRMGMLKEGVRVDRVRGGRQKYKRRASDSPSPRPHFLSLSSSGSSMPSGASGSSRSTTTTSSIQSLSLSSRKATSPDLKSVVLSSRDETTVVLMALRAAEPDKVLALPDPSFTQASDNEEMRLKLIAILCDLSDRELVGTIGWAKQIPGFAHLSLSDQMNLLHGCWLEVLILAVAHRTAIGGRLSAADRLKLIFADDFLLSEDDCQSIFQSVPDLDRLLRDLVTRFRSAGVTRDEFLLLKAVVLFNAIPRLDDADKVAELRDAMWGHLVEHLKSGNPASTANKRTGILTLLLPQLRQVALLLRWFWIEIRNDGSVPMHKLFLEMLEVNANAAAASAASSQSASSNGRGF